MGERPVELIYGSVEKVNGYGSGSGDGSGSGYGYGYGYGSGSGSGSGSGDGSGDGSGSGYGYGSGSGSGYGSGDGSGYGSGSGSGSGKEYLTAVADGAVGDRAAKLRAEGAVLAFWRSDKDGKPCNNGTGPARHIGMIEEEKGPLVPCQRGALHGTMQPANWKGDRLWIVALYPPVEAVDDDKYASLKREIIAEIPNFFL